MLFVRSINSFFRDIYVSRILNLLFMRGNAVEQTKIIKQIEDEYTWFIDRENVRTMFTNYL